MGRSLRQPSGRRSAISAGLVSAAAFSIVTAYCASRVGLASPTPQTVSGVPQQIMPTVAEIGLGNFTMPTGTASLFGGTSASGTGTSGTGSATDSSALDTMMSTPWGAAAAQNAEALGVNASALAATCVIESGCQNVSGTGTITGAFQMSASTYQASLAAALQQDPNLASNIVQGLAGQNDPATQSIAASEYLLQGAQYLQGQGIANPDGSRRERLL